MTASIRAIGTPVNTGSPVIPAAAVAGDTLYACIAVNNRTTTPTGPSGWTSVLNQPHSAAALGLSIWTKTCATGNPGSSATWSLTGAGFSSVIIAVASTAGKDVSLSNSLASRSSAQAVAVTTRFVNELLLEVWATPGSTTITTTAPVTSLVNYNPAATANPNLVVSDQAQAAIGASSTGSAGSSASTTWVTATLALTDLGTGTITHVDRLGVYE